MQFISTTLQDASKQIFSSVVEDTSPLSSINAYKGCSPALFDLFAASLGYSEHVQKQDIFLNHYAYFIGDAVQKDTFPFTGEFYNGYPCQKTEAYPVRDIDGKDRYFFLKENNRGGITVIEVDRKTRAETEVAIADNLMIHQIRSHFFKYRTEFGQAGDQHNRWDTLIETTRKDEVATAENYMSNFAEPAKHHNNSVTTTQDTNTLNREKRITAFMNLLIKDKNYNINENHQPTIVKKINASSGKERTFFVTTVKNKVNHDYDFKLILSQNEMHVFEIKQNYNSVNKKTVHLIGSVKDLTFDDFKCS
jgi:hypothetical protein